MHLVTEAHQSVGTKSSSVPPISWKVFAGLAVVYERCEFEPVEARAPLRDLKQIRHSVGRILVRRSAILSNTPLRPNVEQ